MSRRWLMRAYVRLRVLGTCKALVDAVVVLAVLVVLLCHVLRRGL